MHKHIIYKYVLDRECTELSMLPGAQVLDVQMQNSQIVLWARARTPLRPNDRERRYFWTRPTGHEYEDTAVGGLRNVQESYIATVQQNGLVWHIFEGRSP